MTEALEDRIKKKTINELLDELGVPDHPLPPAPPWHVDDMRNCGYGWTDGTTWGSCDCEDPANPWPPRVQGDGPRDCCCFGCHDQPRPLRGRVADCEYKDHHCPNCHEHQRCTLAECPPDPIQPDSHATETRTKDTMTESSTASSTPSFRPLNDRVVVRRLDAESKSPGGIIIPDNAKEKPVEGVVIAVGSGARNKDGVRVPLDVKEGDRILFAKYSGTEVAALGADHVILREDDVLAVLS